MVTVQNLVKVVLRILSFSSLPAMVLVGYPYKLLLLPRFGDLLTSPSMDWDLEKAIPSLVWALSECLCKKYIARICNPSSWKEISINKIRHLGHQEGGKVRQPPRPLGLWRAPSRVNREGRKWGPGEGSEPKIPVQPLTRGVISPTNEGFCMLDPLTRPFHDRTSERWPWSAIPQIQNCPPLPLDALHSSKVI